MAAKCESVAAPGNEATDHTLMHALYPGTTEVGYIVSSCLDSVENLCCYH